MDIKKLISKLEEYAAEFPDADVVIFLDSANEDGEEFFDLKDIMYLQVVDEKTIGINA